MNIPEKKILYLFTVTREHIALMKHMSVCWEENSTYPGDPGAPAISRSRPYGNSDIYGDIAKVLGIPVPNYEEGEEYTQAQMERILGVHRETQIALQIFLSTGIMQEGTYMSDCSVFLPGYIKAISDDAVRRLVDRAHDNPEHYRIFHLTASVVYRAGKPEKG